ncbi:MAG: DUF4143 domain-containing protein [Candidatus Gracilibacteria bacterium]
MYKRCQNFIGRGKESCFLWGARQTGKSTLLKTMFPDAPYYDLLLSGEFIRLNRRPELLREELLARPQKGSVIIDEVQKIPRLLDEIQWLIVNKNISFILCGSSARKLKRGGGNLLGGRALKYELYPLVSKEIGNFDLHRAINNGLLPRHYLAENSKKLCQAYVDNYLKEEISAEALTRNLQAFSRFLETAAFSNGEIINYTNIATETGVSSVTIKEYFGILQDTLIAYFIPSYRSRPKRRVIHAPKFYFFDVGIANFLLRRGEIVPQSENFGRALEHFVLQELIAHSHYSGKDYKISYWRSVSGFEVDFILGDHEIAIEVKGSLEVQPRHLKGLKAFSEEYHTKRSIVVSLDSRPRLISKIEIIPIHDFLKELWEGKIL